MSYADDDNSPWAENYRKELRAKQLFKDRHYPQAFALYEELAVEDSQVRLYEKAGECLFQMGEDAKALLYLYAAVGKARKRYRELCMIAKIQKRRGETDAAYETIEVCLDMNPDYKEAKAFMQELLNEKTAKKDLPQEPHQ